MKKSELPSISILTITYNPDIRVFKRMLESIRVQTFPKYKIEHIIVDGGSRKELVELGRSYGCTIIVRKDLRDQSEERRSYAVRKAKNDIVLWLESDNILQEQTALSKLVQPFIDDPKIISTFTLHYGLNNRASLLDRYCALFGTSDPVVFYLGKTDREPWYKEKYTKGKIIKRLPAYDVVEFNRDNLPTVGDNGFLTRREVLLQAHIGPKDYVHIDVYVDLLKLGYYRFGVVRNTSIEHNIGNSLLRLVQRRVFYAQRFTISDTYLQKRRYFIFSINSLPDRLSLMKYVLFTVTWVEPMMLSIRGFIRVNNVAWFYHPIVCWLFLIYYMRYTFRAIFKLKNTKTI